MIYLEQHSSFAVLYTPILCCNSAGRIQKLDGIFFHCTKGCRIAGLLPHQILSNSDEWFPSYWPKEKTSLCVTTRGRKKLLCKYCIKEIH